jgi:hypothetical protein
MKRFRQIYQQLCEKLKSFIGIRLVGIGLYRRLGTEITGHINKQLFWQCRGHLRKQLVEFNPTEEQKNKAWELLSEKI